MRAAAFALILLSLPAAAMVGVEQPPELAPPLDPASPPGICALISEAAERHAVPKHFFARLIWKESRFDIRAVSPVGAQGVAQFMPYTARERGLADPFDPVQAIPASALYLADLRAAFGNWGLAAAAYNAGPDRVQRWRTGRSHLPGETLNYVHSITGKPAAYYLRKGAEAPRRPLGPGAFEAECAKLPVVSTRAAPRPAWGAVVAGGRNAQAAEIAFDRARRVARGSIDASRLVVIRAPRRSAGPRWLAVMGATDRSEAVRLCARVRAAGSICTIRQL